MSKLVVTEVSFSELKKYHYRPVEKPLRDPFPERQVGLGFTEIKNTMGHLFLPTYLPDGFRLIWTLTIKDRELALRFIKDKSHPFLLIIETPNEAQDRALLNKLKRIKIASKDAYIIHGNWEPNGMNYSEWVSTQLYFNLGDWVIVLQGVPAASWSDEELIKIATSFKEY